MIETWRVYVVKPRPNGKEGRNFTVKAEPPATLRAAGVIPIRKSTETPDRAEAERFAERMARDLNSGVLRGDDPTVIEVLEKHTDWRAAIESPADTVTAYRQALRRLRPLFGETRGDELSRASVLRVQDELRATLGPGTVNQTLNCVRHAWGWAQEREWVSVDWPRVRRLPVPETEKRPCTDAEVEAALRWLSTYRGGYWLPVFTVLADSGARIGELLRLRGAQVDRAACVLRLGRTKNGEARAPQLPAATMALVPQAEPGELVFRPKRPGFRSDKPMSRRNTLGVLWRALEAIGVADRENLDQHSFRRSWISASVEERVPLTASMSVTGHRSTKVHLDYARRAQRDMAAAVETVRDRRRRAGGARPWEPAEQVATGPGQGRGREGTAQHRTGSGGSGAPKSKSSPPGSRPRASCWSGSVRPEVAAAHLPAFSITAQPRASSISERSPIASPFLSGGHPLGGDLERAWRYFPALVTALVDDPVMIEGVRACLVKEGLIARGPAEARRAT